MCLVAPVCVMWSKLAVWGFNVCRVLLLVLCQNFNLYFVFAVYTIHADFIYTYVVK